MSAPVRDRTIDAVRAYAIAAVVTGHWLVTGLVPGPDGVTTASPLAAMPGAAPVTLLLQTLGLLFFAGGYAAQAATGSPRNAGRSLATATRPAPRPRAPRHGPMPRLFPRRRGPVSRPAALRRGPLSRLARPALALLTGWALLLAAAAALGTPSATLHTITGLVVSPLWFLAPYLLLRAATAPLSRLVARAGPAALLPPIAVGAASDLGLLPGPVALPAAWAVPWLLGMLLARTTPARDDAVPYSTAGAGEDAVRNPATRWLGIALACNGAAALAALILLAGYPVSAVGIPGAGRSNLDPPSLAAVALAVTQIGVFLALRAPLARLLRHGRALRPVAALTRSAVPVYLWHQSVLLAVAGAAALVNPAMPGLLTVPDDVAWAGQRLAWLPVLAVVLAVVIRARHHGEPDYLKRRLRGTLFDGSRARTTHGGDRCAR